MAETNERIKQLGYRLMYRGTKELDTIMARFVTLIPTLSLEEIGVFEQLIEESEQNLYDWLVNMKACPHYYDTIAKKITCELRDERIYKMIKTTSFLFVFATLVSLSAAKTNAVSVDSPVTTAATPSTKTPSNIVEGCALSLAAQEGISIEEATKKLQKLMDTEHVPLIATTK